MTRLVFFKKRSKGFTLIEAIVTAAIMAILAAVAIPMYAGYINDQRKTTVTNLAETAAAAANSYFRRTNIVLTDNSIMTPNAAPLNLYFNAANYEVKALGVNIIVKDLKNTTITSSTVAYR
jgi:prepilin-type N-terminal cleavage/methylation domain-containing protein